MPFDVISFAATKADLDGRGRVTPADSSSIAVVASMLGNPLTALLIGRSMADKKAPAQPVEEPPKQVIDLRPPPKEGDGPVAVAPAPAPVADLPGVPADINRAFEDIHRQAQAFILEARSMLRDSQEAAHGARNAADEARQAALRAQHAAECAREASEHTLRYLLELKANGDTVHTASDGSQPLSAEVVTPPPMAQAPTKPLL